LRANRALQPIDKALCSQYNKAAASPDLGRQNLRNHALRPAIRPPAGGTLSGRRPSSQRGRRGELAPLPAPQRFLLRLPEAALHRSLFSRLLRFLKKGPAPTEGRAAKETPEPLPRQCPPQVKGQRQKVQRPGPDDRGQEIRPFFRQWLLFPRRGEGPSGVLDGSCRALRQSLLQRVAQPVGGCGRFSPQGPTSGQREKAKK